jgi:transcriptional regulator with XRE-family HTH domain
MSLTEIRKSKNLSLQKAADLIHSVEPLFPTSYKGLDHIERRGTDRLTYIRAIALAYGMPESVIEIAAKPSKINDQNGINSLVSI